MPILLHIIYNRFCTIIAELNNVTETENFDSQSLIYLMFGLLLKDWLTSDIMCSWQKVIF